LILAEYMRSGRPLSPRQESLLTDWLSGWMIPDIDTRAEHQAHALEAGFGNMEVRDISPNTWISHRNLFKQARRWWRLGQVLTMIGIRNPVQHGNHRGALRQFEALQENAWFYGLALAVKSA